MLEIGSIIDGKYKILNKIGQGGMSVVYLAMNERANKQWAIKEVRKDGTKDYEVVKQGLIAETDILKRLNHPHLPSIIDVIDCDDTFLIVMDYIEGRTLDYWLKTEGAQPQERVVEWAKQICDVLGYLHSRKPPIIYRDLKPSNVMLKPDGKIMIIDFGTAREFKEQSIEDTKCLGTQGYAAPEQYGGHGQTDARTDIYNLGATMYHLLTGHNPSLPPYEMKPIRQWNGALSSGLEEIVLKCTQRNPDDRYQSCAELMYALEHFNEMDLEYKKKQKHKWAAFLTTCSLTVASLLGCLGFGLAESTTIRNSYNGYTTSAERADDKEEKIKFYKDAVNLDPSESKAWLDLLTLFIGDVNDEDGGRFTQEEDIRMKELLGYTGTGSRTNESYFESNEAGYGEFAFQMGLTYFYFYGEEGNKAMAQSWFEAAAKNSRLDDQSRESAQLFAEIIDITQQLGQPDVTGYRGVNYQDYWDRMTELISGNLTAVYKEQTVLAMYREMVYQIYVHAVDFKDDGVSESDMMSQLQMIESRLTTEFGQSEFNETTQEILDNIGEAEVQVNGAFTSQSDQTGGVADAAD